jgi:hypothetical protein
MIPLRLVLDFMPIDISDLLPIVLCDSSAVGPILFKALFEENLPIRLMLGNFKVLPLSIYWPLPDFPLALLNG